MILDKFKIRIFFVGIIFFILGAILISRLFFIQVEGYDFYSTKQDRQYKIYKSEEEISLRGDIHFKQKGGGVISAATIKSGFLVSVNPGQVKDPDFVCSKINSVVSVDLKDCVFRASKKSDPYEVIAHKIDLDTSKEIEALKLEGISIYPQQWRFYPGGTLASQVLGFVGYDGDKLVGRYGLEKYYEDVLGAGKNKVKTSGSFAAIFSELGKGLLRTKASSGNDIVLTIEPNIQAILENVVSETLEKWEGESAGGIVVNPKTGEILAMTGKPDFDPNKYGETEMANFRNPLVSSIFEMGSVVKPLTMAAAINEGVVTAETTYMDNGFLIFNKKRIENYDGKGRGLVDMQTVLNKSLNTGAVFAMQQLGKENFLKYLEDYGLGEVTSVDLPEEIEGHLQNLSSKRDVEFATASFGHGIAMSPIEFVVAACSLANGGYTIEPFIVKKIIIDGGKDNITEPVIIKQVLKEETSKEISRMLVGVVDEALLGGTVKLDHYSIAAKTGTALLIKPKEEGGGYYEDQYFHSFFGYTLAEEENDRFLIFLFLKDPQGVKYASHTLTNPFMNLVKFLLNYYDIPPDR